MRRSMFKRYLLVSSSIILVSFIIMGSVMFLSLSNYWIEDKVETLTSSAKNLSALVTTGAVRVDDNTIQLAQETGNILNVLAPSINADAFIVDRAGVIQMCADTGSLHTHDLAVPQRVMQLTEQGHYFEITSLGGIYNEKQYVVGVPLYFTEGDGAQPTVVGAVFVASTARAVTAFRQDIVQMCVISAVFAAAISFIFSGAMTYRMVLPLREMSMAATNFGKGDFSQRVRVRSQDEIGELATAFNNMASSLAASENMSRSFVANVSHELKTPMTTIAGFINGILDGTIPAEKQEFYLKIVSSEIKRLSRLVRSMLDLSRIDSGEMHMHRIRFDIKDTVIDTIISFEPLIEQRQITITGLDECESVFVDGDPDLLHQVVYNLVENAVKFVNEGGTVSIAVKEENGAAHVAIRNTGAGIAPDELPLIFDRFYKTDKSRSHDKNGMGLGLYIVKTIVQLHDGEIYVNSLENEFCEFEFFIPTQQALPASAKKKQPSSRKAD